MSDETTTAEPLFYTADAAHQPRDLMWMRLAQVDSAKVQPRERGVPCDTCGAETWHLARGCHRHYIAPAQVQAATQPARRVVADPRPR